MTRYRIGLLTALGFLFAGLTCGQPAQPATPITTADVQTADASDASKQAATYEDIEVFRRILNKTLQLPRYGNGAAIFNNTFMLPNENNWSFDGYWSNDKNATNKAGNPSMTQQGLYQLYKSANDWQNTYQYQPSSPLHPQYPEAQGVYLPGYGVVFTLTLPPEPAPQVTTTVEEAPAPQTEWDRVRQEVRGEKPKASGKPTPAAQPSTADIILKVLAENGHHFKALAPDERLTVVVTFEPAAGLETSVFYDFTNKPAQKSGSGGSSGAAPKTDPLRNLSHFSNKTGADQAGGNRREYELLAKLETEQGNTAQAVKALQKAVEQTGDPRHAAELCLKLAALYLAEQHDAKKARTTTEKAVAFLQQAADSAITKNVTKEPTAGPTPTKLIISANKRLLDRVAAGYLSRKAFNEAASVRAVVPHPRQRASN